MVAVGSVRRERLATRVLEGGADGEGAAELHAIVGVCAQNLRIPESLRVRQHHKSTPIWRWSLSARVRLAAARSAFP